jgi:preprotein translocase subunit SecY
MKIATICCMVVAEIAIVLGIISRLSHMLILTLPAKAWIGGAGVLLLLVIAMNTMKKD